MRRIVDALYDRVKTADDGELVPVPDWKFPFGIDEHTALTAVVCADDDAKQAIHAQYVMSRRVTKVQQDQPYGGSALTYKDTLPADLAPLDASGRVRQTYADMEARGVLKTLLAPHKDYGPLTVHIWNISGSESGWKKHKEQLIDGIVATILSKSDVVRPQKR
jgi:hypothetical protein